MMVEPTPHEEEASAKEYREEAREAKTQKEKQQYTRMAKDEERHADELREMKKGDEPAYPSKPEYRKGVSHEVHEEKAAPPSKEKKPPRGDKPKVRFVWGRKPKAKKPKAPGRKHRMLHRRRKGRALKAPKGTWKERHERWKREHEREKRPGKRGKFDKMLFGERDRRKARW